jgi:hypothetical protein
VHDSGLGLDSIARMPPNHATLRQKGWQDEEKEETAEWKSRNEVAGVLTMS